jgi:hypothetical protein
MRFSILALLIFSSSVVYSGDWKMHSVNIKNRQQNVLSRKKIIERRVKQKKATIDQEQGRKLMRKIEEDYETYLTLIEKQRKEKRHVRFQHPAKGGEIDTLFKHFESETLEEIISEVGIDGSLNKIRNRVRKAFLTKDEQKCGLTGCKEEETPADPAAGTPTPTPTPAENKRIKLKM